MLCNRAVIQESKEQKAKLENLRYRLMQNLHDVQNLYVYDARKKLDLTHISGYNLSRGLAT